MTAIIHNFESSKAVAAAHASEFDRLYQKLWNAIMIARVPAGSNVLQRGGVDVIVWTEHARMICIEEKWRSRDFGDFLCETWSVWRGEGDPSNRVGWTIDPRKKRTDYVAYGCLPKVTLLPAELLRLACIRNLDGWKRRFGEQVAQNNGYETRNVAVPWSDLWQAMQEVSQ